MNRERKIFQRVCVEITTTPRVFYKGKIANFKKGRILSYGTNTIGDVYGNEPGIHAEHDALIKLKPIKNRKKLETINLLVIRLSRTNKLQSSKPCSNCIKIMNIIPEKKGYKIQNIYYSDSEGNIIKTTLNNLEKDEKHYSRYYRNSKR